MKKNAPYEYQSMNLEKKYTYPYRSFNFQQLFFYDIFLRNAYFSSYRSSKYSYVYMTVRSDATTLSKHLRATEGQLQTGHAKERPSASEEVVARPRNILSRPRNIFARPRKIRIRLNGTRTCSNYLA